VTLPELLAPAGDFASVDAALDHGADAIYTGIGTLNLRAHAPNFATSDIPELVNRVHSRNKKVYVTLNTMPNERQLEEIEDFLHSLANRDTLPDALIVSDPGVIDLCNDIAPSLPLHLSTQSGTFNSRSLAFWKKQGVERVVLPREMTLDEIGSINRAAILPTEIFVHGAMCVSISGRCLLGAYLSKRHPNRGDCSQPCRWKYSLSAVSCINEKHGAITGFDVEEDASGSYFLNSRDLCTIELLGDIIKTGVSSLKIEGRNKSVHYVGAVVKVYRAALDAYASSPSAYTVNPDWTRLLDSVEHRPYTSGFYGNDLQLQEIRTSKASAGTRIIGIVKALLPGGTPVIDVKNSFSHDETIEVVPVNQRSMPYATSFSKLTDLNNHELDTTPSNRLAIVYTESKLQVGDMLRRYVSPGE